VSDVFMFRGTCPKCDGALLMLYPQIPLLEGYRCLDCGCVLKWNSLGSEWDANDGKHYSGVFAGVRGVDNIEVPDGCLCVGNGELL